MLEFATDPLQGGPPPPINNLVNSASTNTHQKKESIVKRILIFILSVNWVLGALAIVFAFQRMKRDLKLLVITFLFGIFGYVTYITG